MIFVLVLNFFSDRNTEVLEYVKSLSGLRVLPTEYPDTIRLEFSQRQDGDLSLHLTMHLAADHCGRVYLKGAEVRSLEVWSIFQGGVVLYVQEKNCHDIRGMWSWCQRGVVMVSGRCGHGVREVWL